MPIPKQQVTVAPVLVQNPIRTKGSKVSSRELNGSLVTSARCTQNKKSAKITMESVKARDPAQVRSFRQDATCTVLRFCSMKNQPKQRRMHDTENRNSTVIC